jgi:hypothetical protein
MAYNIYTFNSLETMHDTLVSILHVLNYSDYLGIFSTVAVLVIVIGAITCFKSKMPPFAFFGSALILPAILYAIIFSSRVDVVIIDDYIGLSETVDDVPLGLALPLVACTSMEKILLDVIEDKIEKPSVPSFSQVGYFGDLIGLNYLNKELIIDDFNLLNTISAYTENCVYHSTTKSSEIVRSADLLTTISTPYDIYFTPVYDATGNTIVKTCSAAYSDIQTMVWGFADSNTPESAMGKIGSNFGEIGEAVADARSILDSIAGSSFPAYQGTSTGLLEQSVLINGLYNGLTGGGSSELLSYVQGANMMGTAAAERSSLISATLYIKHLPDLVMYLKVLIIGLFPLVGCFFIASSGKPFLYWSGSLVWISSFMPLTALMHALFAPSVMGDLNLLTGGYNWANQAQIQKIIDDALYTAAILVLTLPTLLGMILGWVAPRTMASAVMFGRQLGGQHGVGDVKTPENYAKQKMEDQTLQAFSATGDEFNTMTSSLAGRLGEGQHAQAAHNLALQTPNAGIDIKSKDITQGIGSLKYTSGITASESNQYSKELSASRQEVSSAMDNLSNTLKNSRSDDTRIQALQSLMNNDSYMKAVQNSDTYSEAKSFVEDFMKQEGLTSKDSAKLSSAVAASVFAGVDSGVSLVGVLTGSKVGFTTTATGTSETSSSEESSVALMEKFTDAYENKFGKSISDSKTDSVATVNSDGVTSTNSSGFTTAEDISHAVNRLNTASETYSKLEKLNDIHAKSTQYGTSSEVDASTLLAQMNKNSIHALQTKIKQEGIEDRFQNFVNADHNDINDERMALAEDLRAMKGTYESADSLGIIAGAARANGDQNAYRLANIASMYEEGVATEYDYYKSSQKTSEMKRTSELDEQVPNKINETEANLEQPVKDHSQNNFKNNLETPSMPGPVNHAAKVTPEKPSNAQKYDIPETLRRPTEDHTNGDDRHYSPLEIKQIHARDDRLQRYSNEVLNKNDADYRFTAMQNAEQPVGRLVENGGKSIVGVSGWMKGAMKDSTNEVKNYASNFQRTVDSNTAPDSSPSSVKNDSVPDVPPSAIRR